MNDYEITRQVTDRYLAAAELWLGCDWTTSFGARGLDLRGLKAKQTRLLAEATAGEESEAWLAATRWLEQVEQNAREARSAASSAVELFTKRRRAMALARVTKACQLEARYHQQLVWEPLRELIAGAAEHDDGDTAS